MADRPVPIVQKRLLDVKVGELPVWISSCNFTPNGILSGVKRGYQRYINKYINVKKGGIGGISMFLVGYVTLSYIWQYDSIKLDRHRKYH